MRFGRAAALLFMFLAMAPAAPVPIMPQAIIGHLERVIAWYREISTVSPPTVDVLISDGLREASYKAVQLAFSFGRAEAALLGGDKNTQKSAGTLQQASQKAADRVAAVQARIAQIDADLPKAVGKRRQTLQAQKSEAEAELALAKEIQTTIQNLVNFTGSIGSDGGALANQIRELERSVPEIQSGKLAPAVASNKQTSQANTFSPESAGVLGLASELLSNHSNRTHLMSLLNSTRELAAGIDRLKEPLISQAREATQRSDQLASQSNAGDPAQLAAAQKELSGLAGQFKQLSTAIVPLGEESIAVGTAESYLDESIARIDQESSRTGRYLLMKAVTLAVVIVIVLFISEMWRRATFRYVHDARRRRQFLLLRRVVVAVAVMLAIVFWFVSELGSLATYAGFVTAGVAVALQSPILSVVAYFFLIGRYGIRVGDRVTISGVTGEVIEIGLVRIYLAELAGAGPDLHPTGRVVVFSNSVIFQPTSALYKQMPGIDYVWHTAVLILSPDSDFQLAEKTLNAAVDGFFAQYRDAIERQYRSLEQSVDMHIAPPKPESRLRFTDAGLQYTVRYPAELSRAVEMDTELLRTLHHTVMKEPKLKFAPEGVPKLQAA
ncbi:MAG TPA: mechanosensitive ion channel domain-containing protein [Bryobacteraceae bacterium]|nr:mechanosensitive ion channel domain-containing protein [Bryobacteraceae bacterium]